MVFSKMAVYIKWDKFLIIVFFFFLIFTYLVFRTGDDTICELPQRVYDYCNNPYAEVTGLEGEVDKVKFKIKSLHIFMRHGDRSALHVLNTKNIATKSFRCNYDEEMYKEMPTLQDFLNKAWEAKSVLKTQAFRNYSSKSLAPSLEICPTGMLTPKGTAQLISMGKFLKEKYQHHMVLDNMHMTTTHYTRTFQTAVSFLYGFQQHFNLSAVPFTMLKRPTFCSPSSPLKCECIATVGTDNVLSCTYMQSWEEELKRKVWSMFIFDATKQPPTPSPIYDFLLAHKCHNIPVAGDCILKDIFTHVNIHGKKMVQSHTYRELSRLKMLPVLAEIANEYKNTHSKNPLIRIFSGHDTTIEPLLSALGVSDGLWPKYAARVVFEHYEHDKQDYFRLLYDGRPLTHLFEGCINDARYNDEFALCPVERLYSMVERGSRSYLRDCLKHQVGRRGEGMPPEGVM